MPKQSTPPIQSDEDWIIAHSFERDRSSAPFLFAYHTHPALEDITYPPYAQQYSHIRSIGDWTRADPDCLNLSSCHASFHDRTPQLGEVGVQRCSPYFMTYQRHQQSISTCTMAMTSIQPTITVSNIANIEGSS
jgi:hypothetical protein